MDEQERRLARGAGRQARADFEFGFWAQHSALVAIRANRTEIIIDVLKPIPRLLSRDIPMPHALTYDEACRRCGRLADFLADVRQAHPTYWCKPVPPFGESGARLVIVGLAPGMHGANASGRPFTGDYAGILLYETLHRHGFASRPVAQSRGDGLRARRLPHHQCGQVPAAVEQADARRSADLQRLPRGGPSHRARRRRDPRARSHRPRRVGARAGPAHAPTFPFAHGAAHALPGRRLLVDSYHCSRYNTNTRRLTPAMFDAVFDSASTPTSRKRSEQGFQAVEGHDTVARRGAGADLRRERAPEVAAAPCRRLSHVRRRRRGAVRRQGARLEEARVELLPEDPATSTASRR